MDSQRPLAAERESGHVFVAGEGGLRRPSYRSLAQQYHSATERIDSTGRADRRGAVGKALATERMTDTKVTILYPNDPEGVTFRLCIWTILKG